MRRGFKYINWLFEIKVWIAGLIWFIFILTIEDWVHTNYGQNFREGIIGHILSLVLFFAVAIIVEMIYERFSKNSND